MKKIEVREGDSQVFSTYGYENPAQASGAYASLFHEQKLAMAEVYQEAFGDYPWYEVYKCNGCEEFVRTNDACGYCGGSSFSEACPIDWLVDEYFPHMLTQYTPGVLVTLESDGKMIGFTIGGAITLGRLIEDKYEGKPEILASIIKKTGVSPDEVVFYENETCVSASLQQRDSSGKLNLARVRAALDMEFPLICGRTINQPWRGLKERQLAEYGYDIISFVPSRDTYEVDGEPMKFFMAMRRGSE